MQVAPLLFVGVAVLVCLLRRAQCETLRSEKDGVAEMVPFAVVQTHTSGYMRTDFVDPTNGEGVVVETEVLHIGVCYKDPSNADAFTKLKSVTEDKGANHITLVYSYHTDSHCLTETESSEEVLPMQENVVAINGAQMEVRRIFTNTAVQSADPSDPSSPSNNRAIIRYYGADNTCLLLPPYKFRLLLTDRCSAFLQPDFFGQVLCTANGTASMHHYFTVWDTATMT